MTAQTTTVNKAAFEQGDKPQGSDYANLIDSFVALADTTAQSMSSDLTLPNLNANTKVNTSIVSAQSITTTTLVATTNVTAQMIIASGAQFNVASAAAITCGSVLLSTGLGGIQSLGTVECVTISSVLNAVVTGLTSAQTIVLFGTAAANTPPAIKLMRINVNSSTYCIPLFNITRFSPG